MLKLVNITKDYVTKGVPTVHALKGLSINFRRNEFVAILGASGCGKTTLLNIIGGLDRYTTGDLVIEGRSTKDYADGDWDTYRNHSVGFVFQSYNLIPHQTIIKNVELALTIGGIEKEERHQRALAALEKVGLGGMEKKRPNQLSGGQMQRVAIARALINEPEILLADEPTGALDSVTSVQIMDLLKEVAKDCLVIMVTHNPDLAEAYANRIVTMKDGLMLTDSRPYSNEEEETDHKKEIEKPIEKSNKGNKKRSSMSFPTATGLSMSNLVSKLKRTTLIAVAGSIGIIGVSMVLSVSQGVHNYIDNMQNDMISQYPLSISEQAVDYASLLSGLSSDDKREIAKFPMDTSVGLDSLINYLMDKYEDITDVKTNDINEDLIEYVKMSEQYTNSINLNYGLDMTNNMFTEWDRNRDGKKEVISLNGLTQMYIAELQTVDGFSEYAQFVDLFTNFMNEIPADKDYVLQQYDILAGEYPTKDTDVVLVVDENQTLTDLVYAQMGFFSEQEFINIARKAVEETKENPDPEKIKEYDNYPKYVTFDDILNRKLAYYPHDSFWKEDSFSFKAITFDWNDVPIGESGDKYDLHFSFKYNDVLDALSATITTKGYSLNGTFQRSSGTKDPANEFKGDWTGKIFGMEMNFTVDDTNVTFHLGDTPSTYTAPTPEQVVFNIDYDGTSLPFALTYVDATDTLEGTAMSMFPITFERRSGTKDPSAPTLGEWKGILSIHAYGMDIDYPMFIGLKADGEMIIHLENEIAYTEGLETVSGYMYDSNPDSSWTGKEDARISCVLKKKKKVNFGCLSRGVYYTRALTQKMMVDAKDSKIVSGNNSLQKYIGSTFEKDKAYEAYVKFKYTSYLKGDGPNSVPGVFGYANALNTSMAESLGSLFSISGGNNNINIDKAYLRSISGLATKESIDGEETIYSFESLPQSISIYPKDFKIKKKITDHLKKWNSDENITLASGKVLTPADRQELTYTDTVELIISVINTMINVVTIALVAFTSLALVVSCFMIAVITYISTMERVKEIGVIRSLGGRKKDVSRLFVAETLIIGLASGLIGIAMTYLLGAILNLAIGLSFGIYNIAALPWYTALIMIAVSILLNVLSGLFPAMKASNQDPVVALRTE